MSEASGGEGSGGNFNAPLVPDEPPPQPSPASGGGSREQHVDAQPVLLRARLFGLASTSRNSARKFDRIAGTVRTREKAAAIAGRGIGGHKVEAFVFDGEAAPEVSAAVIDASAVLISVPPGESGDPGAGTVRRNALRVRRTCARSSICRPSASMAIMPVTGSTRQRRPRRCRRAAASGSKPSGPGRRSARRAGKAVAILRLSGIYGPGQNALVQVASRQRQADRQAGPGVQPHPRADIAQAIDAAFVRRADGIFNVTDDEPTPQGVPIAVRGRAAGSRAAARNAVRRKPPRR